MMTSWPPLTTYQEMTLRAGSVVAKTESKFVSDILHSGASLINPLIFAADKIIAKKKGVYSLIPEKIPTYVIHKDTIMGPHHPAELTQKGVGFGIVYDGLSSDHHVTLLVKLPDRSEMIINANGESCHKYLFCLNERSISYFAVPLQQKVSKVGACGPTVLMLLKHLVSVAHMLTSSDKLVRVVTAYDSSHIPTLLKEYHLAVSEIAIEFPTEYDGNNLYSAASSCKWCVGVPPREKLRPVLDI